MPRIFLFSGLGADARLFERLAIPGWDVTTLPFLDPEPGEDLPRYAMRVVAMQGLGATEVIGGASFGGMVAAEIARQQGAACLVQLGSALAASQIPFYLRWSEPLGRLLPARLLERIMRNYPSRWHCGPIDAESFGLIRRMTAEASFELLQRGSRCMTTWRGIESLPCPLYAMHGARDRLVRPPPAWRFMAGRDRLQLLHDAGHMLTLTHAHHVSAFLDTALRPHAAHRQSMSS